ncbi:hypothetical protein ONZ51_g9583 [Trametes cubensis]|uniref:Uncharacterized protein n=1 Tax=Trametes cubensis TaxID=1111947 RepID=A0AAD7X768_9APHY|nr:hypothetical protein ONZ51_g9583 [Trametes cubensis]
MGKQNERFSEPEKEWLESQYQRDDVQKILARGPTESILKDAAKLLYEDYAATFCYPLPEESEESYKRRRKNAKKDRKPFITRRPAETANQVKARLDDAVTVSILASMYGALLKSRKAMAQWFKTRRGNATRKAKKTGGGGGVEFPALTPQRRRGVGGIDVFGKSPLKQGVVPPTVAGIGDRRQELAKAFHALDPTVKATFTAEAKAINEERAAQELEQAGSQDEVVRTLTVPFVGPWFNNIMEHLHQQVVWTGAAMVGGPDEDGKMRLVFVGTQTDVNGHNFWEALANEIGWELTDLLTWSKHFLKKTNPAYHMGTGGQAWSPDCGCRSSETTDHSATPGAPADLEAEHSEERESPPAADSRYNARLFEEEASALVQVPEMEVDTDVAEVSPAGAERLEHAGMLKEQAPALAQGREASVSMEVDEGAVRPAGAERLDAAYGMFNEVPSEMAQVAPPNSPGHQEATSSRLVIKLPPRPSPPRPRRSARTTMRKEGYNSAMTLKERKHAERFIASRQGSSKDGGAKGGAGQIAQPAKTVASKSGGKKAGRARK